MWHHTHTQDMQMYIDSFKETMDKEVMEQLNSYVNMFSEHKVSHALDHSVHRSTGCGLWGEWCHGLEAGLCMA